MSDETLRLIDEMIARQQRCLAELPALDQDIARAEERLAVARTRGDRELTHHWNELLERARIRRDVTEQDARAALAQAQAWRADLLARTSRN